MVVLWGLIGADPGPWTRLLDPSLDLREDPACRRALHHLYVAVTRARRHLAVYEPPEAPPVWTAPRLAARLDAESPASLARLFARAAAPAEWSKEGEYFQERGRYRQAAECFRRAGEARREIQCIALHHEQTGETALAGRGGSRSDSRSGRRGASSRVAAGPRPAGCGPSRAIPPKPSAARRARRSETRDWAGRRRGVGDSGWLGERRSLLGQRGPACTAAPLPRRGRGNRGAWDGCGPALGGDRGVGPGGGRLAAGRTLRGCQPRGGGLPPGRAALGGGGARLARGRGRAAGAPRRRRVGRGGAPMGRCRRPVGTTGRAGGGGPRLEARGPARGGRPLRGARRSGRGAIRAGGRGARAARRSRRSRGGVAACARVRPASPSRDSARAARGRSADLDQRGQAGAPRSPARAPPAAGGTRPRTIPGSAGWPAR